MSLSRFASSSIVGPLAFVSLSTLFLYCRRSYVTARPLSTVFSELEQRIQRDEGNRGIKSIILHGELERAAYACTRATDIVIITGFPCLLSYDPPTETDGPSGALAIARSLLSLGNNRVSILTDECNEAVILAGAAGSGLMQRFGDRFSLHSFPGLPDFDEKDEERLNHIGDNCDLLIAIERAGPTKDGTYLTMRGFDMSPIVAPLDDILARRTFSGKGTEISNGSKSKPFTSIGIGDGGNEVGMGRVYSEILASSIPNAANIACVVPTEHLLVSSVSNWGGYALAAAIPVAKFMGGISTETNGMSRKAFLEIFSESLVSRDDETSIVRRLIYAGARDGLTKENAMMVDGMPLESSLQVLDDLRSIVIEAANSR